MDSKRRQGRQRLASWMLLLALVSLLAALTGCGKEEEVDPYVYGSLRAVTRGGVDSIDYLFEIDSPEFVFIKGNTGLVRDPSDPNLLEFVVADDLENRAPSWQGKLIGVQKFYSPYVYLMAKRVKDGLSVSEVDSCESFVLPHFTSPNLQEVSGFNLGTMPWDARRGSQKDFDDKVNSEFQTAGKILYMADHEAEVVEAAEPAEGEAPAEPVEPQMAYYLQAAEDEKAVFKIVNVTPALEFAFELLESQELPFVGGVKIADVNPYRERRRVEVTGSVEISWVTYANRYLAP